MARLPTRENLGPRPTPRSSRGVVSFRGGIAETAEVRGIRQQGRATDELFGTIQGVAGEISKGMERQKLAKARSDFLTGKIELDSRFKEDKDFETAEKRYAEELERLRAKTSGGLFGKSLSTFSNETKVDIARGIATRKVDAFSKRRDFNLAELASMLDKTRADLLLAQDPGTRQSLLATAKEAIKSMREQRFLTDAQAEKMGRTFVLEHAIARVSMQPPEEQHRLLGIPEGWSPGDKLPPRAKNGTVVDFIPEDVRVKLARGAMPGVNARVAIEETDRIVAEGGSVEAQIAKARKIKNPTVRDEVERRVKAEFIFNEKLRGEKLVEDSQTEADRILASGLGDEGMLDAAREIEDEDLRDATVKRVKARITEDMTLDKERRRELKRGAWATVIEKESTDDLTAEMRAELDGTTLAAMDRYARTKQEGKEPVQDWDAWTEFTGQKAEDIAGMDASDYQTKYRNKFDDVHYERGLALLRREKSAEAKLARQAEKDESKRRSYADADRVANQIIARKGLDKKKNAETIGNIKNAMSAFVDRYVEKNEGRYPTRTEMIKFAAGLVVTGEIKDSGIFFDDDATRVNVLGTKDEAQFRLDTDDADIAGISVATGIPQPTVVAIIKVLKETGTPVTLRNIEGAKAYIK